MRLVRHAEEVYNIPGFWLLNRIQIIDQFSGLELTVISLHQTQSSK